MVTPLFKNLAVTCMTTPQVGELWPMWDTSTIQFPRVQCPEVMFYWLMLAGGLFGVIQQDSVIGVLFCCWWGLQLSPQLDFYLCDFSSYDTVHCHWWPTWPNNPLVYMCVCVCVRPLCIMRLQSKLENLKNVTYLLTNVAIWRDK